MGTSQSNIISAPLNNNSSFEHFYRAKGLLWLLLAVAVFIRLYNISHSGLTTLEADSFARYSVTQNLFSNLSWKEPLTAIVMRLAYLCGEPPIYARYIFAAFGILALLVIVSCARKMGGLLAAIFVAILAGFSSELIFASREILNTSIIIFALLIVQWAHWTLIINKKTVNIIVYLLASVTALFFSPLVAFLMLVHVIRYVIYVLKKRKRGVFGAAAASTLIIAAPFLIMQLFFNSGQLINISDFIFALPFIFLVTALILAAIAKIVIKQGGLLRKIIKYIYFVFLLSAFIIWGFFQINYYKIHLQKKYARDLSSTPAFLESVVKPNDKILLVSDINVRDWFRTKYYFYNFLTSKAKTEFERINTLEWKTNFIKYLPDEVSKLWLVGIYNSEKYVTASNLGLTNIFFPLAIPVSEIFPTSLWNNFEHLKTLRAAKNAVPMNARVGEMLLDWYRSGNEEEVVETVLNGGVENDILNNAGADLLKKAAINHILYSWKDYNISNFYPFDKIIGNIGEIKADKERAVYLYRIFAEKAIRSTNIEIAAAAIRAAKKLDADNPFLFRLETKLELIKESPNYKKIIKLNNLAKKEYEKRFDKKFIESDYANAFAYKAASNYVAAFKACHKVLSHYAGEKLPESIRTNLTEKGMELRKQWRNNHLAWLGRCNSFISSLLSATGDYENAILWETKNLDENNSEARRITSRERLAKLYIKIGGIDKAIQYFNSLANAATSTAKRISWKLESAQLYVTMGDTVSTYDKWDELQKEIERLPMEERWKWSKDKRFQRVLRYLSRRSKMDIRNVIIMSLGKKADKETNNFNAARLYTQIAEIYKCKLQYDNSHDMFEKAQKTDPMYFDSFLSEAILNYRMKRFAKAEPIFTNMLKYIEAKNVKTHIASDWRYIILNLLITKDVPPSCEDALIELDNQKAQLESFADYLNFRGNILECFGKYDMATNQFTMGISTNKFNLNNYLDLGYLICKHSDAEAAGKIIDDIMTLNLTDEQKEYLENDWRFIILHYISLRPYNLKE